MITKVRTIFLCLVCMAVGAALVDPIDSVSKHFFAAYYRQNTYVFWLSVAVNLVAVEFLVRRAARVVGDRMRTGEDEEKPGVYASLLGIGFKTTAFIRICLYISFYLIGIGLVFLV